MPKYDWTRGRKFDNRADALKVARNNIDCQATYDWYVVESADASQWYLYRGGTAPVLINGSKLIYANGLLETPQTAEGT